MHMGRRGNDQAESTHFQGWGKTSGGEGQGQSGVRVDRLVFELFRTVYIQNQGCGYNQCWEFRVRVKVVIGTQNKEGNWPIKLPHKSIKLMLV